MHRVYPDAITKLCQFTASALSTAEHRPCGVIRRLTRRADNTVNRRYVDNAAAAAFFHQPTRACNPEKRIQINADNFTPLLKRCFLNRRVIMGDTGIIHQNIQTAIGFFVASRVATHWSSCKTSCAYESHVFMVVGQSVALIFQNIRHHDIGPLAMEQAGHFSPQPTRTAGYKAVFPLNVPLNSPLNETPKTKLRPVTLRRLNTVIHLPRGLRR